MDGEGAKAAAGGDGDLTIEEVGRWDDRYGLLFIIIVASMLLTACESLRQGQGVKLEEIADDKPRRRKR